MRILKEYCIKKHPAGTVLAGCFCSAPSMRKIEGVVMGALLLEELFL